MPAPRPKASRWVGCYAVVLEVDVLGISFRDASFTGCDDALAGPEARDESENQPVVPCVVPIDSRATRDLS